MKQDHQTSFGRRNEAVPIASTRPVNDTGLVDKWKLLTALTEAAENFDLNHRSLSVLRALLGFHPDRLIAQDRHSTIVFPANRTLSARLGGMPESTLRRHIAALIKAGIVSRHDSANRKRFARGKTAGQAIAFGFDLSPLARMASCIMESADRAAKRTAQSQALRAELAALRQSLITQNGECPATQEAFRILRRKPDLQVLTAAITNLKSLHKPEELSGADSHNERHIQGDSKIYSEDQPTKNSSVATCKRNSSQTEEPSFIAIIADCKEYQALFPEPVDNWQGLSRISYAVVPMMGIDRPVYAEAIEVMGPKKAIAVVLYMLEGLHSIQNAGGYLRSLIQQCRAGALDMVTLARRLVRKPDNCQLTI